jgi:predicted RNA-binding protein with PIN domain
MREELLGLLGRYQAARGHRVTVVFDGTEGGRATTAEGRRSRVRVIFSPRGQTADEVILKRLSRAGSGWVVVTSDRELERAATGAGAEVVGAEEFASKVLETLQDAGPGEADEEQEEEEEPTLSTRKRGNPRRASRRERRRSARLKKL